MYLDFPIILNLSQVSHFSDVVNRSIILFLNISHTSNNLLLYPPTFPSSSFKTLQHSPRLSLHPDYFHLPKMSLLGLPIELRLQIYDFCFPPPGTSVQVVPYMACLSSCRLNLPLHLYLVCKTIYAELPHLKSKLRQLDFIFLAVPTPFTGELRAKDNALARTLQYTERLRVTGAEPPEQCAVKVLELQPAHWSVPWVKEMLALCWPILSHRDMMGLEVILTREDCTIENDKIIDGTIERFLFKLNLSLNMWGS